MEENIQNQKEIKKSKIKTKTTVILIIIFTILIIVASLIKKYIYPQKYIEAINNNYDLEQYSEVSKYISKLDILNNYLKNDKQKYETIQYKVKFSQALILFENNQFEESLNSLLEIEIKDDLINAKINDCKYELGKISLEAKQYDQALKYFQEVTSKDDINDLLDSIYSKLALKYLKENKYTDALTEINKTINKNTENYQNIKKQIYYEYGKHQLDSNDYNGAIYNLQQAQDYEDSTTLINNAYIRKAEQYIKSRNLQEAKKIYDSLSSDLEYNGIKVIDRKNQLNKLANLINITGKKYATKTYCESRNVWKYDGRWKNWYIDTSDSSEYIDTELILNDDGTATLKGTAYFYAFNNFSSLSQYCQAKIVSRQIEIKNITSMPSTFEIDENTKLLYSKGTFTIKYSERDNYSTSFYNMYISTVTY